MSLLRALVTVLVLTASAGAPALAQHTVAPDLLQAGEQLRFSVDTVLRTGAYAPPRARQWRAVVLDSLVQGDLWVHARSEAIRVPLDALTALQVRQPSRSTARTLARGVLVGAAFGAGLSIADYALARMEARQPCWNTLDPAACDIRGAGAGKYLSHLVVPCAAIGLGISVVLLPTLRERWTSVALPKPAVAVSLRVP